MMNLKRSWSLFLVFVFAATMSCMPISGFAARQSVDLVNADFDGSASLSDYGISSTSYVSIVDSADFDIASTKGNALAIGASGDSGSPGITKDVNAKIGTLTVSADVWHGGSQWLQFRVKDSSGTVKELVRMYKHANGYAYAFNTNGGDSPNDWQGPAYKDAPAGWWKVTLSLNLGSTESDTISGMLKMNYPNGTEREQNCTLPLTDIASVEIRNNSTCTKSNLIDNLLINHTYTELNPLPEGYLFLESFDEMTTLDGDTRFKEDYTDNKNLKIQNGALAVTEKNTKALVMNLSEPVSSGQVTWSMKVTPGNNFFNLIASDTAGAWNGKYAKASIGDGSQLNIAGAAAYNAKAGSVYTFNAMYDFDNHKSIAQWVDENGDILTQGENDFNLNSLAAVAFQGGWTSNCGVTYFDDISVRVGNYLVKVPENNILWEENFDSMTAETLGTLTVKGVDVIFKNVIPNDTKRNNSIGIAKNSTAQGELTKNFTKVSEDCVRFTYSVYVEDTMNTPIFVKSSNGTNYVLAQVYNGAVYHSTTDGAVVNQVCMAEGWVTVENIINLDTHSNKITVYDADGNKLGSGIDAQLHDVDNKGLISDIAAFNLRTWASEGTYTYLDDVKIEKFVARPELTDKSVNMTDYKGESVLDITNPTPGITAITLDFGTSMKADSLTGAVTLIQDGNTIPFSGMVSGSEYVMTVNGLKPEKAHKLTVSNTVENNKNQTMENAFVLNFTTAKGSAAAALISVKKGDADAKLSEIATGDILNINAAYENTLAADMDITYIVAYYSGTSLDDVQVIGETSALDGAGALNKSFVAKDMTGITSVMIFMWDSAYGAYPYCAPITIR